MIYVAFYKYKTKVRNLRTLKNRIVDEVICCVTGGQYSHCEIAVPTSDEGLFNIYSSSPRDGGVRVRFNVKLASKRWDLVPIRFLDGRLSPHNHRGIMRAIFAFHTERRAAKYDWRGVASFVCKWFGHSKQRYFCSEFVGEFIGVSESQHISPSDLYGLLKP